MLGKIPAARLALIEKIVAHALKSVPRARQALTRDFLRVYFRGVAEEDLRAHRPSRSRRRGARAPRVRTPPRRQPRAGRHRTSAQSGCRDRRASRAGARRGDRHAVPRRFDRRRLQPDEHRRAPDRAPGAGGAARRTRRPESDRRRTAAGRASSPGRRSRSTGRATMPTRESSSAGCTRRSKTCARPSPISPPSSSASARSRTSSTGRACRCRSPTPTKRARCSRGCTTVTSCSSAIATTA